MLAVVVQKKYLKIPKCFTYADILEIRVDLIKGIDLKWTKKFLKKTEKPWILTIRKQSQGGNFEGPEALRLKLISEYLALNPTYLDIEYDVDLSFVKKLKKSYPNLKFIRSFHDFKKTPNNLDEFISLKYHPLFEVHKFAFRANSMLDTLKLMSYLKKNNRQMAISLVAMGKYGHPLRICGRILKNAICYASANISNKIASQLSVKELVSIYNYQKLNHNTKIYALIGKKISHSIGHLFHNFFFSKHKINAVYIKIPLYKKDLGSFFKLAASLPIFGLSITTPFKMSLKPYLPSANGPINTLKKIKNSWHSKNTDGIGAFTIIKDSLKKKILMLGSGPTAIAIFAALKESCIVDVYSRNYKKTLRTYPKAVKVIKDFNKINFSDYDLIINAASYKAEFFEKVACRRLERKLLFFDVNYQEESKKVKNPFIKKIDGKELFFYQAIYQQMFWNKKKYSFELACEFKKKWMKDPHQL